MPRWADTGCRVALTQCRPTGRSINRRILKPFPVCCQASPGRSAVLTFTAQFAFNQLLHADRPLSSDRSCDCQLQAIAQCMATDPARRPVAPGPLPVRAACRLWVPGRRAIGTRPSLASTWCWRMVEQLLDAGQKTLRTCEVGLIHHLAIELESHLTPSHGMFERGD